MTKGQISFDLMLAMIVAIIFVGSIALVAGVMADNAKIDSIRSQERQIGNEIAKVLNSSTILKGSDFRIEYVIPKIRTANTADPDYCEINFVTDYIEITYTDSESIITQTLVPFTIDDTDITYNTPNCGQLLVIEDV